MRNMRFQRKWDLFTKRTENRVGDPLVILLVGFLGGQVPFPAGHDILAIQRASPQLLKPLQAQGGSCAGSQGLVLLL